MLHRGGWLVHQEAGHRDHTPALALMQLYAANHQTGRLIWCGHLVLRNPAHF
ncbi:Uncharacterised protein [Vibrio cholerae]|nr:Uncharacterised protein [Vibrio cholerae]